MNNVTVVFTPNNARIIKSGQPFNRNLPHVENVSIRHLSGIAPHLWVLDSGSIRAMTDEERAVRETELKKAEAKNDISAPIAPQHSQVPEVVPPISPVKPKSSIRLRMRIEPLAWAFLGAILALVINRLI